MAVRPGKKLKIDVFVCPYRFSYLRWDAAVQWRHRGHESPPCTFRCQTVHCLVDDTHGGLRPIAPCSRRVYAGVAWRRRSGSRFESRGPRGARRAIGQLEHLALQQSYLLCQLDVGVDRFLQEFTVRRHSRDRVTLSVVCRIGGRRYRGRYRRRSWPFARPLRTVLGGRGCCCSRAPRSPARHVLETLKLIVNAVNTTNESGSIAFSSKSRNAVCFPLSLTIAQETWGTNLKTLGECPPWLWARLTMIGVIDQLLRTDITR